jgi:CspA family cold shock protein
MSQKLGTVKWFNAEKGWGYITETTAEGTPVVDSNSGKPVDFFVHYTKIVVEGFKTLAQGQKVTFEVGQTDKGVQAENVTPVK